MSVRALVLALCVYPFALPVCDESPMSGGTADGYYVGKTGSDANPGTASAPLSSIQRCAELALPGDICFVLEGDYDERVSPPSGGTPGKLITFKARGTVTMRGFTLRSGYIRVEGFQITNTPDIAPHYYGIYLQGEGYEILDNSITDTTLDGIYCTKDAPSVSHSLISGNAIRYADGTGITLFGESNIAEYNDISHILNTTGRDADGIRFFGNGHIIRYNTIHDITEAEAPNAHTDAFQTFDNSQPPTTNILIEGNYCYNLDHQMVIISALTQRQSSHITIRNNVFESPENPVSTQAILVRQTSYVTVVHNTFVNARYRGIYIGDGATHATVKNNIFYNVPRYYEIEANSEEGFEVGYNLHYPTAIPFSEPQGIYADPEFVDIAKHDFHLRATSPAVDSGEDLGVPTDKDRNPRPQGTAPDRGAFEFTPSSELR